MISRHLAAKNGYWYAILMVKGETGGSKQKWIGLHLKEAGNKRKADADEAPGRPEYIQRLPVLCAGQHLPLF